jgi:hypothetical protein
MSIRPAERGCCTIKHIILSEKAWPVIIIKFRVVPPQGLNARWVLPQWEFKHLVGGAAVPPDEIAGIRVVGSELLRVLTLFLVVGKYAVDILGHVSGPEDGCPIRGKSICGSSAYLRVRGKWLLELAICAGYRVGGKSCEDEALIEDVCRSSEGQRCTQDNA